MTTKIRNDSSRHSKQRSTHKGPAHPRIPDVVVRALDEIGMLLDQYEMSQRTRAQRLGRGLILECVFAAWGLIDPPKEEENLARVLDVAQIIERKHAAMILRPPCTCERRDDTPPDLEDGAPMNGAPPPFSVAAILRDDHERRHYEFRLKDVGLNPFTLDRFLKTWRHRRPEGLEERFLKALEQDPRVARLPGRRIRARFVRVSESTMRHGIVAGTVFDNGAHA